jgi:hypothetical protein
MCRNVVVASLALAIPRAREPSFCAAKIAQHPRALLRKVASRRSARLLSQEFSPMSSPLRLVALALAAALSVALGGCASAPAETAAAAKQRPALPTVRQVDHATQPAPAENEIVARATRAIQNNRVSDAVRTVMQLDPELRARVAGQVAAAVAERDPMAAAAFATALPVSTAQEAATETAANAFTRRDPDAALRWAAGIDDFAAARAAQRTVIAELLRAEPRNALAKIEALPASAARDDMLTLAVGEWARHNSADATAWLNVQPDSTLKPRLTSAIAFEVAQTDPNRAIALAETMPAGRNRWLLLAAIGQTWVAKDEKAALGWAQQLPAGEARDAALAGVDTGLGVPASRRLASAPRGSTVRVGGGTTAAATWDELNSPAFAAWLATQPAGMSREQAILEYVRQRGAVEPTSVGQWIASLPGGPSRERAMEIYLDGVLAASPADAANWLRTLPRSDRSDEMVERTAKKWLLTNPAAAQQWLNEISLPPDRKQQLLRDAGL